MRVGAYLDYFFYWAEMGAKLDHRYLGGFLVSQLWLGIEPGEFVRSSFADDSRAPGLRAVLRGRVELNYRTGWFWLYNRFTAEARVRTFTERDPFRDAVLSTELSIEEAFAPLFGIYRWGEASGLWLYGEITVAGEVRFGLLDLRPSAGVIVERLFDAVTINLDFYYSLRKDSAVSGPGVLLLLWWQI